MTPLAEAAPRARAGFLTPRLLVDVALLSLGLACFWLFPTELPFLTRLLIMLLFVLSLDLVLGYAGLATLGHAALYGTGAYAAALVAIHVTAEPLTGLLAGAAAGALVALVSGLLVLRTVGLTFLMMTIAFAQIMFELANKWRGLTGGDDGLAGFDMDPLFGLFRFDLFGRTGYLYVLGVLAVCFVLMRVLVASPFGLAIRGIHQDRTRMEALGTPVYLRLLVVYVIAGAFAGVAGALAAQTAEAVSLQSLGFVLSAEALIMLVLGGAGRLYGAVVGVVVFKLVQHVASAIDPFQWYFAIGAMLVAVVLFAPKGLLSLLERLWQRLTGSRSAL